MEEYFGSVLTTALSFHQQMSMSVHLRTEAVSTRVQTELAVTDVGATRALYSRPMGGAVDVQVSADP